jgi:Tat protein secretion system quality control protein TatD with DNase activity
LIDVIAAIAELRDSTSTEVADITAANAHALFRTQPS